MRARRDEDEDAADIVVLYVACERSIVGSNARACVEVRRF